MRWRGLLLAAAVAVVGAPACGGGGDDDDGYRLEVDGQAEVTHEGETSIVDDGHRVATGDTVRMLEGDAVLELPGERSVLLRALDGDASVLRVAASPSILEGDAVVVAEDEIRFAAGDVEVTLAAGAVRVQRGLSVTLGVYDGAADVRAAGRPFAGGLRALRQLSVPATGALPRDAVPLVYDEREPDPWDLRFLGDAIDLGVELEKQSRGFTGQLGPRARADAALLRRVLPPLDGFADLDALLDGIDRTPGESLVGAAIVVEHGAPDRESWQDVFSFREAGAQWGLVALDQAVQRRALLDRIGDAFGRSPLLFAARPSDGDQVVAGPNTTTTAPAPTTTPPTTGTSTTTTVVTVPPTTVPTIPLPTLPEELLGTVVDELIGGLLREPDTER